jgi:hypothetical protein
MTSHTVRRGRGTRSGIALYLYLPLSHMGTARPNPKVLPLLHAGPRHLHDRAPALDRKRGSQHDLTHNSERQKNKVWPCLVLLPASIAHGHRPA